MQTQATTRNPETGQRVSRHCRIKACLKWLPEIRDLTLHGAEAHTRRTRDAESQRYAP